MDDYQPRPDWPEPRNVSIHQITGPSPFRGQVLAHWPAGPSYYLFVFNPNATMTRLLDRLSMWGGASKRSTLDLNSMLEPLAIAQVPPEVKAWVATNEVSAWEFHTQTMTAENLIHLINSL